MTIYDKLFLEGSRREAPPVKDWAIYKDLKAAEPKPKRKPKTRKPKD